MSSVPANRAARLVELIGNTPIVEIRHLNPNPNVRIFAKLEGMNPGGSVKDRICKSMIEAAERDGLLGPGSDRVLFEPTSGNTGIGLAMIAAARGYPFVAVIPESASVERRKIMAAYGAEFIITDGVKGTNWAIEVAHRLLAENDRYLMLDQFNNPANPQAHYEGTAPEVLRDVPDVTHFVAGMGTGGTLMGVQRYVSEHGHDVQIVGLEPVAGSKIQGLRNMEAYVPAIYDEARLDHRIMLDDDAAFRVARQLAGAEGLFVGISSGAALWGAQQLAEKLDRGTIVVVFPDGGEKYLTTPLFDLPTGSIYDTIL